MASRKALKLIEKLSKKKKGQISISVLKEGLKEMDQGWGVEKVQAALKVTRTNSYSISLWVSENYLNNANLMLDSQMIKWKKQGFHGSPVPIVDLKKVFNRSSGEPRKPDRGQLYSSKVKIEDPFEKAGYKTQKFDINLKNLWVGVEGYEITSSDGETYITKEGPPDHNWEKFKDNSLWKFLYKNGASELAQDYLGGVDDIDSKVRSSSIRTKENTGTCPVCLRNIKLRRKRMVDHGYEINWSVKTTSCPGVGEKPYELSNEGCKKHLKNIRAAIKENEARIKELGNDPESIDAVKGRRTKTYQKGSTGYKREMRRQTKRADTNIKYLKDDMKKFKKLIRDWKKRPLPNESLVEGVDRLLQFEI